MRIDVATPRASCTVTGRWSPVRRASLATPRRTAHGASDSDSEGWSFEVGTDAGKHDAWLTRSFVSFWRGEGRRLPVRLRASRLLASHRSLASDVRRGEFGVSSHRAMLDMY